ncbi:sulfatase-like hydrolase/transferase [Verrucomicrobia bacterium]|nr:sulfatase-like hydrolase/transferase [Verrucomicrobiota bacterium]
MKPFLSLIVTWLAIGLSVQCLAGRKPNVLLIMADDVGLEPIGCYGGESFDTPQVDALARKGMWFEHCYSMPVCHPSRLALMTGRYPFRLKTGWGGFPKEEEDRSIGRVMQKEGYATAVAGKWQMTLLKKDPGQPGRVGFDKWLLFGWHEGARFHDPFLYRRDKPPRTEKGSYGPDLYADFLSAFMENAHKQGKPFFAYFPMALAHDVTDDLKWQVPYVPGKDRWMDYGEMIASMDSTVGKLVATLDRLGIREETVVIFTGDNGTASRSKLRHLGKKGGKYEYEKVVVTRKGKNIPGGKGSLRDAGTRVPLIVNWPGTVKAGAVNSDLVDFSDWLPTLAELAGAKLAPGRPLDGQSFANSFRGNEGPRRAYAFSESRGKQGFVRDQRWKLYANGKMFDLKNDPAEKKALPEKPEETEAQRVKVRLAQALDKLNFK